jgi:hypothetical protein
MRKTIVLEAMEFNNDMTNKNSKLIFETVEHGKYNESDTLDWFL